MNENKLCFMLRMSFTAPVQSGEERKEGREGGREGGS